MEGSGFPGYREQSGNNRNDLRDDPASRILFGHSNHDVLSSDFRVCQGPGTIIRDDMWVFKTDEHQGIPFHTFLAKVHPSSGVPRNAVFVTLASASLMALIIVGVGEVS